MSEPETVPEWVCTLVGRLLLDAEALRRQLTAGEIAPDVEEADPE